jgi:hypothetical protein
LETIMRIELPDGQWADLRDRITHGQVKDVIRAIRVDDLEFMAVVTRTFVRDWYVLDTDGATIPVDAADGFDRLPSDVASAIYNEVLPVWRAANPTKDKLAPTPPSSDA